MLPFVISAGQVIVYNLYVPITSNIKNNSNVEVKVKLINGDVMMYDNCSTVPNLDNDNVFCKDNEGDENTPWDLYLSYPLNTSKQGSNMFRFGLEGGA